MSFFVGVISLTSGFKIFTSGQKVVISGFAKSASGYTKSVLEAIEVVSGSKIFTSGTVNTSFALKIHLNVKKTIFGPKMSFFRPYKFGLGSCALFPVLKLSLPVL